MNKKIYSLVTALLCASCCASVALAQEKLWATVGGYPNRGAIFHVNKDGTDVTPTVDFGPKGIVGSSPSGLFRASDGTLYGVTQDTVNYLASIVWKITSTGVVKLFDGVYVKRMVQGNDGYIYGIGGSVLPYNGNIVRFKPNGTGLQTKQISQYGFTADGGLLKASNGSIYGMAYGGGNGFIYKIKTDFTGIDVVYSFQTATGKRPSGKLIEGTDGFLYGHTTIGGTFNKGVVFKIRLDGTQYTKLHDFNKANGATPTGGMVLDSDGYLYGTTAAGGTYEKGVIFKISTTGTGFTVLHNFNGTHGEFPSGTMVMDSGGKLYGQAQGPSGTVLFSIAKNGGPFTKLGDYLGGRPIDDLLLITSPLIPSLHLTTPAHNSTGSNITAKYKAKEARGALNYTLLLSQDPGFNSADVYHSTTREFSIVGLDYGTIYYAKVKSSIWPGYGMTTTFKTKGAEDYAFISGPVSGAVNVDVLNTKVTCNVVPEASTYTVELSATPDFSDSLLTKTSTTPGQRIFYFERLAYSTKYYARVKTELSTAYGQVRTFTTIAEQFVVITEPANGAEGIDPTIMRVGTSAIAGGKRYTVEISTSPNFSGSTLRTSLRDNQLHFIYKNLAHNTAYYLRAKSDVSTAYGPVINFTTRSFIPQKRLWGMTADGGVNGNGTVFSFSVDSLTFSKHYDYRAPDEWGGDEWYFLKGTLARSTNGFYGLGVYDGTGSGDVFHISNTGAYTKIEPYGPHNGSVTFGSDNYVYIIDDWVNLFRGGIYARFHDGDESRGVFTFRGNAQGVNPQSPLLELPDGYLYGTALSRGNFNRGTLYRVRTDGTNFQVIHHFTGATGAYPGATVIDGGDGYLYGMTPMGGTANLGVIYKIKPDGTGYTKLLDFAGSNGSYPYGQLLLYNGSLYGMASGGGTYGNGIIFKIARNGSTFVKLHEFNGTSGAIPLGELTSDGAGVLYGMTSQGSVNGQGNIFKINSNGTGFQTLFSFTTETGGAPNGGLLLVEDTFTPVTPSAVMARAGETDVLVHPNPFHDSFTAQLKSTNPENVRMMIMDMNGTVVTDTQGFSNTPFQLGEDLKKGLYVLKVIRGGDVTIHRVVKR